MIAVVQKSETVFQTLLVSSQHRLALDYRQLYVFVMRYYRDISKKLIKKNLLTRSTSIVNVTRLRQIINLARQLSFEFSKINTLRKHSRSIDFTTTTKNHRSSLVTDDSKKVKRFRCDISRIENYEENRAYLFI